MDGTGWQRLMSSDDIWCLYLIPCQEPEEDEDEFEQCAGLEVHGGDGTTGNDDALGLIETLQRETVFTDPDADDACVTRTTATSIHFVVHNNGSSFCKMYLGWNPSTFIEQHMYIYT